MKGRFAPSPTGHIHLGNVWVALLAYLSTRSHGGYRQTAFQETIGRGPLG